MNTAVNTALVQAANTFALVKPPFFIDYIENMPLDGEVASSLWDYQEKLNLTDDQIEALGYANCVTDYECLDRYKGRVTYTISEQAEITCDPQGVFSTVDIFGNKLNFTIAQECKVITLVDLLNHKALIEKYKVTPRHQVVLDWLEKYKENINQLVKITFTVIDEHSPDPLLKSFLFRGDVEVEFNINGRAFNIAYPTLLTLKEEQGKVVVEQSLVDISTDSPEHYSSLFEDMDVDQIPKNEFHNLVSTIEGSFYKYFNVEAVPMWQERLLESFKHDDLLGEFKKMSTKE